MKIEIEIGENLSRLLDSYVTTSDIKDTLKDIFKPENLKELVKLNK